MALREDMLTDSGASPVMTYDLADIVVGPIDVRELQEPTGSTVLDQPSSTQAHVLS